MKSIILGIILTFNTLVLLSQTRYDVKLKLDGFNREFIVVVPSKAPPSGGYPIVIMLHGTSGDGEKFYNISGWKELGQEENFITVFPSSLRWCWIEDGIENHNTRWVNGNVTDHPCSGPPQIYVDDVKFLKTIVQLLRDTLPVNKKKVYASGFSNGSSMTHKLAIEAGDIFSAVAGSSAPLAMGDSAMPIKRIPEWYMVGTLDDRHIVPPFTELPFGRDTILNYLGAVLHRAKVCQGVTDNFIFYGDDSSHVYVFNESIVGGISSSPYIFSLNKGQLHEFPNGTNYPLNAPKLFWEFFKQSSLLSTQSIEKDKPVIEVFPNPSNNIIHLNIKNLNQHNAYHINVINALGQIVYQTSQIVQSTIDLDLNNLGKGLFIIKVETGNQFVSKQVLIY
ncbi:MAG: T9SS type A sorting domain-containing protein [Saprospiraceae bacterium]